MNFAASAASIRLDAERRTVGLQGHRRSLQWPHGRGSARHTLRAELVRVEFKTHSAKAGNLSIRSRGGLPEHWHQMNIYMGKFRIDRAMYYAVCKDDDRIHTEWLRFDNERAERMMDRARRIINMEPPERISNDASWYQCKFCDYRSICHSQSVHAPITALARMPLRRQAMTHLTRRWSCTPSEQRHQPGHAVGLQWASIHTNPARQVR